MWDFQFLILGGGLGSYTPSKIQMTEKPFQLGVSRAAANSNSSNNSNGEGDGTVNKDSGGENGVSWSGSSTSSDLLF